MATVLIGWELGTGLGHVVPLLAVARGLRDRGHRPILALNDLVEPAFLLRQDPFPVFQAPYWHPPAPGPGGLPPTASFADVLASTILADPEAMHAVLGTWDGLIDLVKPDLVVSEFAPLLTLAVRGRIPTLVMGNGYAVPPSDLDSFPPFQPKTKPLISHDDLLARLNEVQRRRGAVPLERLPALFEADAVFVNSLPHLDPYAAVRAQPADGPIEALEAPAAAPAEPHIFAYVGVEHPHVKTLINGLIRADLPATVYLRGVSPAALRRLQRPNLRFLEAAPRLAEILRTCSVAVHYGGHGTATSCLGVGRPQLALPRHMERRLTAAALRRLNVGHVIPGKFSVDEFAAALQKTASDARLAANAARLAEELAKTGFHGIRDRIVDRCVALIAGH